MQKVHAHVLKLNPYKDIHHLATLLFFNGTISQVLFFGTQAQKKNSKPQQIEIGQELEIVFSHQKSHADLLKVKEWVVLNRHQEIRNHYSAFSFLHLMSDFYFKFLPQNQNLSFEDFEIEKPDLNYLLYKKTILIADEKARMRKPKLEFSYLWLIFLLKNLRIHGLFPNLATCEQCQIALNPGLISLFKRSGFICQNCYGTEIESAKRHFELWNFLNWAYGAKLEDLVPAEVSENFIAFWFEKLNEAILDVLSLSAGKLGTLRFFKKDH